MSIDEGVHYEASLDKVRIAYACYHDDYKVKGRTTEQWWGIRDKACAEFDRWLDQVKADAWDEGADALEHHQMHVSGGWPTNPYREQEEA